MSGSDNGFGKFTSLVVLLAFFFFCYLVATRQVQDTQVTNGMFNALLLMAGAAFQYLCGSSSSSKTKDRQLAETTKVITELSAKELP